MLSFVTICRNDNYGEDFLERFTRATFSNLYLLQELGIDYEYIVVDWNSPDNNYVYLQDTCPSNKEVKHVVVDSSVVSAEGLSQEIMYEYFAKNVGIRNSVGDYCCVLNSDIILSPELLGYMQTVVPGDRHFYKPRYSISLPLDCEMEDIDKELSVLPIADIGKLKPLSEMSYTELIAYIRGKQIDFYNKQLDPLGEVASGDYLFVNGNFLRNEMKGFDETNPLHRTSKRQSSMDSELVINMTARGYSVHYLQASYYHIIHNRCWIYDSGSRREIYHNKDDWGLASYNRTISDNVTIIEA